MKITVTYQRSGHCYKVAYGKGRRKVVAEVYKSLPPGGDPEDPSPFLAWYIRLAIEAGPLRTRKEAIDTAKAVLCDHYEGSDSAGPQRPRRRITDAIVIGEVKYGPPRKVPVGVDIYTNEAIPLEYIMPEYHAQAIEEQRRFRAILGEKCGVVPRPS